MVIHKTRKKEERQRENRSRGSKKREKKRLCLVVSVTYLLYGMRDNLYRVSELLLQASALERLTSREGAVKEKKSRFFVCT